MPMVTPSAPSAKAAAMPRPSTMPPAATIGTSTFSRTACIRAKVWTSSGIADAGALRALDDQPVDPGIDRLLRPAQRCGGVIDRDARILEELV